MKKRILTFLLFISISFSYAQKTVAVLSGSTWSFYDDFSPALRAAPAGSTIYLPGGTFDLGGSDTINKPLTIIGVGFRTDSTLATGKTTLIGILYFATGGNNVNLIGFELSSVINPLNDIENVYIQRCKVNGNIDLEVDSKRINNIVISECVLLGIILGNGDDAVINNIVVENSILEKLYFINGGIFRNNIFNNTNNVLVECDYSEFYNNVFLSGNTAISCTSCNNSNYCTFVNNLFVTGYSQSAGLGSPLFISNITGASFGIFENVQGYGYSQAYDYRLKSSSPGKNAGTDGTDIGIYGGAYPYKDGAVPPNPHISTKAISPTSAANGTLPVNIKVVAQDR